MFNKARDKSRTPARKKLPPMHINPLFSKILFRVPLVFQIIKRFFMKFLFFSSASSQKTALCRKRITITHRNGSL
jgi:hypothetical protein